MLLWMALMLALGFAITMPNTTSIRVLVVSIMFKMILTCGPAPLLVLLGLTTVRDTNESFYKP